MLCVVRKGPVEACSQASTFPSLFFCSLSAGERFSPSICRTQLKDGSPVQSLEKPCAFRHHLRLKMHKAKAIHCNSLFRLV